MRDLRTLPVPFHWLPNAMSDVNTMMHYDAQKKSTGTTYLLWFFFGMLGGHRFYLGETGTGAAILIITVVSWMLMFVAIGFFTIAISGIWVLVDLFLIPGMVQKYNSQLASRMGAYAPSHAYPS